VSVARDVDRQMVAFPGAAYLNEQVRVAGRSSGCVYGGL